MTKKMLMLIFLGLFPICLFGQADSQDVGAFDVLDDVQSPGKHTLNIYLDSYSGQLNKDAGPVFSGNEFEFGAMYSHNFGTVPWLSIWTKALVVVGNSIASGANNEFEGILQVPDIYPVAGIGKILAAPRAQVGLNLGGHSIFAMDTRGLLANENYYTFHLPANQSITLLTVLELWAVPIYSIARVEEGFFKHQVLDLFQLRADYSIRFARDWSFITKLGFRFTDDRNANLFAKSFAIRWENQLLWSVTKQFYMWTQVRWQIDNLVPLIQGTNPIHGVYLQAGLGYTFDFSKKSK
ncbi:MAG: hypothetical protein ACRCTQ_05005 [Brevinemataceae bacterium]